MKLLTTIGITGLVAISLAGCHDGYHTSPHSDRSAPAVPSGVFTITGDLEVEVRWNPVRENGVAGYGVYRSSTADGAYRRLATVDGAESSSFVDYDVTNGVTYFYAVDAFDYDGDESALSYETAFDTPRPAGAGVIVFALQENANSSGLDWSNWNGSFVRPFDNANTDIFVQRVNGILFAKGTAIGGYWNDIQSLGYTESMDEVSWAPEQGWSINPNGIELIEGHTYVVWTHESHFAKFRVVSILETNGNPSAIVIDWAYQIDQGNPELSPLFQREEKAGPDRRVS